MRTILHNTHLAASPLSPWFRPPLLLWGILSFLLGLACYLFGVALGVPRAVFRLDQLYAINQAIVWYSGIPVVFGLALVLVDLLFLFERKRLNPPMTFAPLARRQVTVALTAYNDEESIAESVKDFLSHPLVSRVLVVSNDSTDDTLARARAAGAVALNEPLRGYGRCVMRCLTEAVRYDDVDLIILCEGDRTFRAYDIDKLLAYAPHADIVNGTRTSEPLRQRRTQLSTFLYYGNFFVGKLLEAKHLGRSTLTDVGTTYKLCRRTVLPGLLEALNPSINLEFNAHFVDVALATGHTLVECPVTFHPRVGASKGGNANNWRGLAVGLRMIRGIVLGWKRVQ